MKSLKRVLRQRAKKRQEPPSSARRLIRNPGADYEETRHNIGAVVVEGVLSRAGESLGRAPARVPALAARIGGTGEKVTMCLLPNTYMNESGRAVRAMLDYYRISPSDMLVIHDDIDLPFGRLRLQVDGGSGGHNGIRSIEAALGTSAFSRLKLGVGRPPGSMDPADFVLRRFAMKEQPKVALMVEDAADVVELWTDDRARAQELAALRGRHA